ncbi:trypsin-like serine protease [Kitasatospora sp. NPDC087314]|uniref:trypsin-like serine protease n=1 Tax=Kitasatospora sp. NPDC087314 TaxID=3364068 RepID=UPI00382A114A
MATALAALVLLPVLPAGTAHAADHAAPDAGKASTRADKVPGGFASWQDLMTEQDKLDKAADRILEATRADKDSGYAGVRVSAEKRELSLYWRGVKPRPVEDLVKALGSSVRIVELQAPYSRATLQAEVDRVLKDGDPAVAEKGTVVSAGPREDGTGVSISVDPGPRKASLAAADTPLGTVTSSTGIPALVERGEKATSLGRSEGQAFAGAYMRSDSLQARCSTSYTIDVGDRMASALYQLTAAHCVSGVDDGVRSVSGGWYGSVKYYDKFSDIAVIAASSPGFFQNWLWMGTWSGDSRPQSRTSMVGSAQSHPGDFVCSSGAASGDICNIQVVATDRTVYTEDSGTHGPMVQAQQLTANTSAGGQGDSGGPVLTITNFGTTARGVISSGRVNVPCTGYQNRICYSTLFYSDISSALSIVRGLAQSPWATVYTG